MSLELAHDIRVVEEADGVRYVLPKRDPGLHAAPARLMIGAAAFILSWPFIAFVLFLVPILANPQRPPLSMALTPLIFFGIFCSPRAGCFFAPVCCADTAKARSR
jgi:hypothetical protein